MPLTTTDWGHCRGLSLSECGGLSQLSFFAAWALQNPPFTVRGAQLHLRGENTNETQMFCVECPSHSSREGRITVADHHLLVRLFTGWFDNKPMTSERRPGCARWQSKATFIEPGSPTNTQTHPNVHTISLLSSWGHYSLRCGLGPHLSHDVVDPQSSVVRDPRPLSGSVITAASRKRPAPNQTRNEQEQIHVQKTKIASTL